MLGLEWYLELGCGSLFLYSGGVQVDMFLLCLSLHSSVLFLSDPFMEPLFKMCLIATKQFFSFLEK